MINFLKFVKAFESYKQAKALDEKLGTNIVFDRWSDNRKSDFLVEEGKFASDRGASGHMFMKDMEQHLDEAKIYRIEDDIKKLLILTKVPNKNDMLPLPFPTVFLDVAFEREDILKLGIDIGYPQVWGLLLRKGNLYNAKTDKIVGTDLRISLVSKQTNGQMWFDTFNVSPNITDESLKNANVSVKKLDSVPKNTKEFIHLFVLAFLNFLYNPEIQVIESSKSEEQNAKRISRGKPPIPISYCIRLTGHLKEYINSLSAEGVFEYHYRFWVRGFFRTLRAERYRENIGKRIWIPPFIKGKGVLVDKYYEVVKDGSEEAE